MFRISILGVVVSFIFLPSCAAVQGAHGDAISAQEIAAANAVQSSKNVGVNTETVTSSTPSATVQQNAVNNASKMIAPLH